MAGRLVGWSIAWGTVALGGALAGTAAWLGSASQGAAVAFSSLLAAGVSAAASASVALGMGFLALGALPRRATAVAYGLIAWSFLVDIVGGLVNADHRILDTSAFYQSSMAPAVPPDWSTDGWLVGAGLAAAALGVALLCRRDLAAD